MNRIVAAVLLGVVALPLPAHAHGPGVGTATGFVATVSSVEPNVVGLQARIVLGDKLLITNLSRRPVEILDPSGEPFIRIPAGRSHAWHDPRVAGRGDPPPAAPGAPEATPRFVKNWSVPGRAAGRAFAVQGILGWVPPEDSEDKGVSLFVVAGGAFALVVFSAAAAYLLGRGRP